MMTLVQDAPALSGLGGLGPVFLTVSGTQGTYILFLNPIYPKANYPKSSEVLVVAVLMVTLNFSALTDLNLGLASPSDAFPLDQQVQAEGTVVDPPVRASAAVMMALPVAYSMVTTLVMVAACTFEVLDQTAPHQTAPDGLARKPLIWNA